VSGFDLKRLLVVMAPLVLGANSWLPAQVSSPAAEQQANSTDTFTMKTYSRLTVVDVLVYDGKENPVRGLPQSAFTILEDGKPQPIRAFSEYTANTALVTRQLPKLPPHIYTNLQPSPVTSAVNILLLDSLNTSPTDQIFIKDEATRFLKSMQPGTRIAIMALGSRLRLLQGFTTDSTILLAALNTKKNRSLPSPFIDTASSDAIESLEEVADADAASALQEFENEQSSFQTDMRHRMTLEALNQIASYVADIKGRKNLIWFTSGVPLQVFPQGGVDDLASMNDYSRDLRHTTDLMTAAQVAVYPVDAGGVMTVPSASVVHPPTGFSSGRGDSMGNAIQKFNMQTSQAHLAMDAVADATGGVAYYNTNGLKEAVAHAIANGENYYTLFYVPPDPNYDGKFHKITVKVNVPNVHLSYRTGYYSDDIAHNEMAPGLTLATKAPEPYGNNMAASMGRGVPTSTQLLFTVRMEPHGDGKVAAGEKVLGTLDPKLVGKALHRYDFQYSLPGRQITFREGLDKSYVATLEFDIAAFDVFGKPVTSISQTINLTLTEERYQQLQHKPFELLQDLDLPAGELFVRMGILDGNSDKTGTLEIPLAVTDKLTAAARQAAQEKP
jgi:VWFA-related protein